MTCGLWTVGPSNVPPPRAWRGRESAPGVVTRTRFPQQLVRQANGLLRDKVLLGSDLPVLTPDRWLGGFAGLEIKDEVRPLIRKENAFGPLGLASRL